MLTGPNLFNWPKSDIINIQNKHNMLQANTQTVPARTLGLVYLPFTLQL